MNKLFLIICLISMIFLCALTQAASCDPPPIVKRTIPCRYEESFIRTCATIAQSTGFYPTYLGNLGEMRKYLDALHKTCEENKELEGTALKSIADVCLEAPFSPSTLLSQVKVMSEQDLLTLQKTFQNTKNS